MPVSKEERDAASAFLVLSHINPTFADETLVIIPNDQFDIGRKDVYQSWGIDDLTISTHHLRFHCVTYEDEGGQQVLPMIYVRLLSSNPMKLVRSEFHGTKGDTISNSDGEILLDHGDVMQLTPAIAIHFETQKDHRATFNGFNDVKHAELKRLNNQFHVSNRLLGAGGNACVYVAFKRRSRQQVACKIVPLPFRPTNVSNRLQDDYAVQQRLLNKRETLMREFNVLKDINHPNIISLEKVFCASFHIYIFQELITGGDLLSYIDAKGALSEPQGAAIIRQLLKAVDYLHDNQVVHRDIKPENVLMTSWGDGARVVLTDFGQARTLKDAKQSAKSATILRMQTLVGTHGYTAPEVYQHVRQSLQQQGGYSKAIDIWSIGCITATILTDDLIFPNEDEPYAAATVEQKTQALASHWNLSIMETGEVWRHIGRKAKSFIRACLVVNESSRLTAKKALHHKWFTDKYYANEIDSAYERAIRDWRPREKSSELIEFIDTADITSAEMKPDYAKQIAEETKYRVFEAKVSASAGKIAHEVTQKHPVDDAQHPFPSVYGEFQADSIRVPRSQKTPLQQSLPTGLPSTNDFQLHSQQQETSGDAGRLSILDFAPPHTQRPFQQNLRSLQEQPNENVPQSRGMLDDRFQSRPCLVPTGHITQIGRS